MPGTGSTTARGYLLVVPSSWPPNSSRWRCAANILSSTNWKKNVTAIGAPNLHFHDQRHTGNTLAAATGSSLRDLMTRMGHDSSRAAMIYQHATNAADQLNADGLSLLIEQHRKDGRLGHVEGTNDEETNVSSVESSPQH